MSDPAAMEGMMGMMKGNMAMMIPQTLIMGWINAFFSGFVISMSPIATILSRAAKASPGDKGNGVHHAKKHLSAETSLRGDSYTLRLSCRTGGHLLTEPDSETSFPVDTTVQIHAPVWCRNSRPGCEVGIQFVMVLPHSIRTAACVQLHSRQ